MKSTVPATARIVATRLRQRPFLHLGAGLWDRLRDRLCTAPTAEFQFCRHDSRPGPDRPAREAAAGLEAAAFVAAVTGTGSDLSFFRLHLDMSLPTGGLEPISSRRGSLLAAWAFAYDVLADGLDEPALAALRRTMADQAQRTADELAARLAGDWPAEDPDLVASLAGVALAALSLLPDEAAAADWLQLVDPPLRQTCAEVAADGWWPTGFEDWNLLLPLLVRVGDAWMRLADEDRLGAPVFEHAWRTALFGLAPTEQDTWDFDRVGRPGTSRCQAVAEERPGTHYRWLQEPCRWVLGRLARRHQHPGFRVAIDRWRAAGLGRGTPFGVLWPEEQGGPVPPAMPTHHVFEAHGVAVWRSSLEPTATGVALSCGPAHGGRAAARARAEVDADANSVIVWAAGAPLVCDTGALGEPGGTLHNVVLVDGRGQLGPHEAPAGSARLQTAWLSDLGGLVIGQAGGAYPPEAFVRRFDRHLAFAAEYVLVWDHVHSARRSRYEWLLHTIGAVQRLGDAAARLTVGDAALWVTVLRPGRVGLEVRRAVAPGSGTPLGTALRVVGADQVESTQFLVLLAPGQPDGEPPVTAHLATGDGCVGARLDWPGGGREEILFATRPGGIALEWLRTDAAYLALRRGPNGDWTRLLARAAEAVLIPGGAILTATQAVDAALEATDEHVIGELASTTGATVALRCPFTPRGVLVDGAGGKARIDRPARRISVRLTAGTHRMRITGR